MDQCFFLFCTSPAACSGCDWQPVWHNTSHTPTTPLSTAWWGHGAPVATALCHLAVSARISSCRADSTGLFDQILMRLPLRKEINRMPQEDGKLTCGLSFSCDFPCRTFRWQSLLLVCKCEGDFLVLVHRESF